MKLHCKAGQHLSSAEQAVVDYINEQQFFNDLLSISDIAEGAFVSIATVSRAIRKCGFSSLAEMKFRMTESMKENPQTYKMNRVLSMSYTECTETIKQIDIPTVIEIARVLRESSTIYLLANGITSLVASEFALQLQCQKIHCEAISDSQMMKRMDLLAEKGDVVFIISLQNTMPELVMGAKLAKQKGATVITCCCTRGTALDEVSDLILYGYTQSIYSNKLFGCASRLGLFIITRTIAEYMLPTDIAEEE